MQKWVVIFIFLCVVACGAQNATESVNATANSSKPVTATLITSAANNSALPEVVKPEDPAHVAQNSTSQTNASLDVPNKTSIQVDSPGADMPVNTTAPLKSALLNQTNHTNVTILPALNSTSSAQVTSPALNASTGTQVVPSVAKDATTALAVNTSVHLNGSLEVQADAATNSSANASPAQTSTDDSKNSTNIETGASTSVAQNNSTNASKATEVINSVAANTTLDTAPESVPETTGKTPSNASNNSAVPAAAEKAQEVKPDEKHPAEGNQGNATEAAAKAEQEKIAEEKQQKEAEEKAKEETRRKELEETKRKAGEEKKEAERKAQEEATRKQREEEAHRKRLEDERKLKEEEEAKKQLELKKEEERKRREEEATRAARRAQEEEEEKRRAEERREEKDRQNRIEKERREVQRLREERERLHERKKKSHEPESDAGKEADEIALTDENGRNDNGFGAEEESPRERPRKFPERTRKTRPRRDAETEQEDEDSQQEPQRKASWRDRLGRGGRSDDTEVDDSRRPSKEEDATEQEEKKEPDGEGAAERVNPDEIATEKPNSIEDSQLAPKDEPLDLEAAEKPKRSPPAELKSASGFTTFLMTVVLIVPTLLGLICAIYAAFKKFVMGSTDSIFVIVKTKIQSFIETEQPTPRSMPPTSSSSAKTDKSGAGGVEIIVHSDGTISRKTTAAEPGKPPQPPQTKQPSIGLKKADPTAARQKPSLVVTRDPQPTPKGWDNWEDDSS
eukprot:TRINITY_DN879_c0_g1_i1.p1 TRINITY_DN879_c0_g1~~TRINITY_DN879_c0_g1_i1.p1  ORF type:complete len:750 (+),score=166.57 TRINITY_DN879_c0_g1_i1:33-2252(+)